MIIASDLNCLPLNFAANDSKDVIQVVNLFIFLELYSFQ